MANAVGFRSCVVKLASTGDVLDMGGAVLMVEVTNNGGTDTKFYPNGLTTDPTDPTYAGTYQGSGIPVKAGQTRQIPMQVRTFRADAVVDVVGFRM